MADEIRPALIEVEVVYALPHEQTLVRVAIAPGASVGEAIESSGLAARYPEINERIAIRGSVGIFGKAVALEHVLSALDQVEIYRPLTVDPKEARRRRVRLRATKQKSANPLIR